jgi:hypothetical protein
LRDTLAFLVYFGNHYTMLAVIRDTLAFSTELQYHCILQSQFARSGHFARSGNATIANESPNLAKIGNESPNGTGLAPIPGVDRDGGE